MDVRFRIRTREGEELTPRTVEIFSELVRSGVICPQDLVHDALTGEWVPAGAHPMVRLFQDPLVLDPLATSLDARLAEEEGIQGGAAEAAPSAAVGETGEEWGLSLTELPAATPEAEAQAFIARMEAERSADPERPALAMTLPLVPSAPSVPVAARSRSPERDKVRPAARERLESGGGGTHFAAPAPARAGGFVLWAGMVAVVGALVVTTVGLWGGEGAASPVGVAEAGVPLRSPRGVPSSEEEIRHLAFEGFLQRVEGVRGSQGLGEVPPVWLEGRYLASAAAFPQVRRYWERALVYLETVREGELDLYRRAYLDAAEEAGLQGPVRSLRLATASGDFDAGAVGREEAYRRMEALAQAALALHDVLLELDGRVTYEPMRGRGVSADPVLEAAGADPEAQALVEVALDRVLRALNGTGGAEPVSRSQVSGWLVDALRRSNVSAAPPS